MPVSANAAALAPLQIMKDTIFEIVTNDPQLCQNEASLVLLRYRLNKSYSQLMFIVKNDMLYAVFDDLTVSPQLIHNALNEVDSKVRVRQVTQIVDSRNDNDTGLFLKIQMVLFIGIVVVYTIDYFNLL